MADKTTSFFKGQMAVRIKGQTQCTFHREHTYQLYCVTCSDLACIQCVSTIHRRHDIANLSELTPQKKTKIQQFIDSCEDRKRYFQQNDDFADKQIKENSDLFDKLSTEAIQRSENMKQDIDVHTAKTLSILKQIQDENDRLVKDYKIVICTTKEKFHNTLEDCKKTLQTGTDIQVHDTEMDIKEKIKLPSRPSLKAVTVIPNRNSSQYIEKAFDVVRTESPVPDQCSTEPGGGAGTSTDRFDDQLVRRKEALPTKMSGPVVPKQRTHVRTPKTWSNKECLLQNVAFGICATGDEALTYRCYGGEIERINKHGQRQGMVASFDDTVISISVSPTTSNVWSVLHNADVMEVAPGQKPMHRFNAGGNVSIQSCICVTRDEHILVGADNVTKFTTDGRVVKTALTMYGKPLFTYPTNIAASKSNGHIAVVDGDKMVVMDEDLTIVFRYPEQIPKVITMEDSFAPVCITYDSKGNMILCQKNSIHILSVDGKFLRQLHSELAYTHGVRAVGIDSRDETLWVVLSNCQILLLQYQQRF